ncbi:hypothetical protein [Streptomyces sp. bgisy100]|uniref:hypothetical protein n=1 Tax=Streptomyces sp. bgisy100 TaxID=3413783 RepID=UPI003D717340
MARNRRNARRLVADGNTYLWSLSHSHRTLSSGGFEDCCDIVALRLLRSRGCVRILFPGGPGRFEPGGTVPSGTVGTVGGGCLNLHEPGTVRALLDEALAAGWRPEAPRTEDMDGWAFFDTVVARRSAVARD